MAEAGNQSEQQANFHPKNAAVLMAEKQSGKSIDQLAQEMGMDEEDARVFTEILQWLNTNFPPKAEAAQQREIHTDDDYRLPTLGELVDGGGNYLMPAFSAEKAKGIREDDDMASMAERGMMHILTPRQPLTTLFAELKDPERVTQVTYKDISSRILEFSILYRRLDEARSNGQADLINQLLGGENNGQPIEEQNEQLAEKLLMQAEGLHLLKPAQTGIESEAQFIRERNHDPAEKAMATLLRFSGALDSRLKNVPGQSIRQDTFLPHQDILYASAFGRYCDAKSAAAPVTPVV